MWFGAGLNRNQTLGNMFLTGTKVVKRGGRLLILLLSIVLLYYGSYFVWRGPRPAKPQVIAHRGAHRGLSEKMPENTLAAFREAVALGADWLTFTGDLETDTFGNRTKRKCHLALARDAVSE